MAMSARPKKISRLILIYAGLLVLSFVVVLVMAAGALTEIITSDQFVPANSVENAIREQKEAIQATEPFDPSLVPDGSRYALISHEGQVLDTDMDQKTLAEAQEYARQGVNIFGDRFYYRIARADGDCILQYYIKASYKDEALNQRLPSPETMMNAVIITGAALYILLIFLGTRAFSKRLKGELAPLMEATNAIRNQDLEYKAGPSGIWEFNQVLDSMDDMRLALKQSLEQQWREEQEKQEQISALAHDIKTPLTIIKGNSELLAEEDLNGDQAESVRYIHDNAEVIEEYTRLLMEVSQDKAAWSLNAEAIPTAAFLERIKKQAVGYTARRQIRLCVDTECLPGHFTGDRRLLIRAVMNIIANGADYTPEGGRIELKAAGDSGMLVLTVTDGGPGFSADALRNAARKFYMGDKSRSCEKHYGMGLYIADSIISQHRGSLCLENDPVTGHGRVVIKLPIEEFLSPFCQK
ncbi:HAMP domain-containing sensor histidine kinase [Eubacterium sp. 1001713B170207_170306_E7]|uniref:HAMP domain-containing sensor histidine kinase n=1 Tax=Eubacterium sp. 1001713B170207_170306_E7 TaxID=2787097 RepID=UPI00189BC17C|nr:HAMP domain-containing sensor histidine kinase [Eubacterium sp. 1001713B170207_170306_E7]